jgi:hypothetical protein
MGSILSFIRPIATEHREFIHNVYLRAPAIEVTYDLMREMEKGHDFYPTQIGFAISAGHSTWDKLLDRVFFAYKIDHITVQGMFWSMWVTKHVPTFSEDSGESYTARSKIVNDQTDSKILASYIVDVDWDFYFTLETRPTTGLFVNSPSPPLSSYLRPTEEGLIVNK